jgi:hypothetical protein
MVVLCVATLWVTTKNAPFSDRNKSFQTFLKTFEIASNKKKRSFSAKKLEILHKWSIVSARELK